MSTTSLCSRLPSVLIGPEGEALAIKDRGCDDFEKANGGLDRAHI